MLEWTEQQYGRKVEKTEKLGKYDVFLCGQEKFLFVPVPHRTEKEMSELHQMAVYLVAKGDLSVATLVPTTNGKLVASHNGQYVALFRIPAQLYARTAPFGKELAKLHALGRYVPSNIVYCNRIGQWKQLWGQRVDQMELFWKEKWQQREDEFTDWFVESFPYYAGLAENAIQYVTDTELDEQPYTIDAATICHERLPQALWVGGKEVKLPLDWVYDHCARDLAEWVRALYMQGEVEQMHSFFREYERITPLSAFAWRLVYARLLFPIPYFECVEGYYLTESEQEKKRYAQTLRSLIDHAQAYESFLASFYEQLDLPKRFSLPVVRWLKH
ncbi:MAG: spore coat protein YutH [Anoxybacillus sp.]|nr:spore coat protein YutH [Anoxybacillus sp.]MCL6585202.1 spore coat protein YutH [Anoxybacillus sp.]